MKYDFKAANMETRMIRTGSIVANDEEAARAEIEKDRKLVMIAIWPVVK